MLHIVPRQGAAFEPHLVPTPYGAAMKTARAAVETATARFQQLLIALVVSGLPTNPGRLMAAEREIHAQVARECVDAVVGECLKVSLLDPVVLGRAEAIVANTLDLRPQNSTKTVRVTLLGGSEVAVWTAYCLRRPPTRRGRRRGKGGRQAEGNGLYPALAALGIHFRVTPALASEAARLVAISTEAEAHETLSLRGVQLGRKTVSRLARRFAKLALKYRDWKLAQTQAGYKGSGLVRGKRLVIGTDGGRIRLRETRRRGKRRASGRRGFDAPWKEPKVLIVYEIDQHGRKLREGLVRYDATMQDADGLFAILVSLLREIGAQEAAEWVIVGDGADWIWDRVDALIERVGYSRKRVTQVVDFYHAMQRVQAIAEERKDWTDKQRKDWVDALRPYLKRGNVEKVIEEALKLCRGRRSKKVTSLLGYFTNHRSKMRYGDFRKRGIPLGSGAVESCVRRTINLRLKGNGIFFLKETAEGLLHIRAQVLCGRWNQHVAEVLEPEALWKLSSQSGSPMSRAM